MLQGHWKDPSMTAKYLRDKHQITTDTVQHLIKQLWQEWNDQDENASSAVSTDVKMTASLVLGGGTRTRVSPGWCNLKITQLRTRRRTLEVQKARLRSSLTKFRMLLGHLPLLVATSRKVHRLSLRPSGR